jgi:hypothetical protein
VQATDQQRRRVHERLVRDGRPQRISRRDLKVALTRGSRIPRRHRRHLHRFTPALLALVPMYAAYQYLVVDDTICVVDPDSYTIVDVIPGSIEQAGPSTRQPLALSASQMRCIYDETSKDVARVDVRVRLALGAEVPQAITLHAFTEDAIGCAPELAAYRYVMADTNDLVVVDPADRSVASLISP